MSKGDSAKVIASECAAWNHPQNTLSGFRYCLQVGVDGIEFDVHLSADAEVVVQHDYRLNPGVTRSADGNWLAQPGKPLTSMTLAEIRSFDVGRYHPESRESRSYPEYRPEDGVTIPTLDEFIAEPGLAESEAELWIELKTSPYQRDISSNPDDLLRAVIDKVSAAGLAKRVVLLAFEWDLLDSASNLAPEIQTNWLTIDHSRLIALNRNRDIDPCQLYGRNAPADETDLIWTIGNAGGDWWGPYVLDATPELIREAHGLGVKVNCWGVESTAAAIDAALLLGCDAITLAYPKLAMQMLDDRRRD